VVGGGREGEDGGMHIAFVDESGDVGTRGSPTRHFVLCAVMVRHDAWLETRRELEAMRHRMDLRYGLGRDKEVHAAEFLGGDTIHCGLDIPKRTQCVHHMLRTLRGMPQLHFLRHAVRKETSDVQTLLELSWKGLGGEILQVAAGAAASCGSQGMVVVMDHHGDQPQRSKSLETALHQAGQPLLDHPFGRKSHDSLFLQCADLLGYLSKQSLEPNRHFRRGDGRRLIRRSEELFGRPCPVVISVK